MSKLKRPYTEGPEAAQARRDIAAALAPVDTKWLTFYDSWVHIVSEMVADFRTAIATGNYVEVGEALPVVREALGDAGLTITLTGTVQRTELAEGDAI
jgi:hypothetical protein